MSLIAAVTLAFVRLTGPDGQRIDVNPLEVTSVREPRATGHFAKGTRCLIFMVDGAFIAVAEDCATVRGALNRGD